MKTPDDYEEPPEFKDNVFEHAPLKIDCKPVRGRPVEGVADRLETAR